MKHLFTHYARCFLLVASSLWAGDLTFIVDFAGSDVSRYQVSDTSRLKVHDGNLVLTGQNVDSVHPYFEIRPGQSPQFLRVKSLRIQGQNIDGARLCLSRDSGTTWYWFEADSSDMWVRSQGTYETATPISAGMLQAPKFRKSEYQEYLSLRIFLRYPFGYDYIPAAEPPDSACVGIDQITLIYDNDRDPANVYLSPVPESAMDTIVRRMYPDSYRPECDTCVPHFITPIITSIYDSVAIYAHAFNDSGEYIGTVPLDSGELCGIPLETPTVITKPLDTLVQVGPNYFRLVVSAGVLARIRIHVLVEGNLIALSDYRAQPGDTLVLAAMAEDSFGNRIGEVEVEWFATGDSAGADGIGLFVGDKSGTRTKIVAGPELGDLGIRYMADTLITAVGVSMETVCLASPIGQVKVRNSGGGGGQEITNLQMRAGDTVSLYVAAYDSKGLFLTDLGVWWDGDGVVKDHIEMAFNNSLLVTPGQNGNGRLTMSYRGGTTGRIRVVVEVSVSVTAAYRLEIRTGPNGTGTLLDSLEDDVFASIGQVLNLYASVVDSRGNHICDTVVEWSAHAQVGTEIWTDTGSHIRLSANSLHSFRLFVRDTAGNLLGNRTNTIHVAKGAKTIVIRSDSGGSGIALSLQGDSITVDMRKRYYAAAYDSDDAYIGDISVIWTMTDTAQGILPWFGKSFIYAPSRPGQGRITAKLARDTSLGNSHIHDSSGIISVGLGEPARMAIQTQPVEIMLGASYQFSAIVKDRAGNILPSAYVQWKSLSDAGAIDARGLYQSNREARGRVVAICGSISDTSSFFGVNDGYVLTDSGGVFAFAEGVSISVPAQAGLRNQKLDVDLKTQAFSLPGFIRLMGPLSLEDCSQSYFEKSLQLSFDLHSVNGDTLTKLGLDASAVRVYQSADGTQGWQAVHNCSTSLSKGNIFISAKALASSYVVGVDLQTPRIDLAAYDPVVDVGSGLNLQCTVEDNLRNCRVRLLFRAGNDPVVAVDSGYTQTEKESIWLRIPSGRIGSQGFAFGIEISDGRQSVWCGDSGSVGAYSARVRLPSTISPVLPQAENWTVFSIPHAPAIVSPKEFFSGLGVYGFDWNLASIQDGAFVRYDTTATNFPMETCRAYWLAVGQPGSTIRMPVSYTSHSAEPISFAARPRSWTGCGIPFDHALSIGDIRKATGSDADRLSSFMSVDSSGWSIAADSLYPWKGYYVYNLSDSTVQVKFPSLQIRPQVSSKAGEVPSGAWTLGIRVGDKSGCDDEKIFGGQTQSDGSYRPTPMPLKLPLGDRRQAKGCFVGQDQNRYFVDTRELQNEGGATWRFYIENPGEAKGLSVAFRSLGQNSFTPEKIAVIDPVRHLWFDITQSTVYGFAIAAGGTRELKIAAGTSAYVQRAAQGIRPAPDQFGLDPNYPNPFNPVTVIRFQVPLLKGTDDMPGAEWASLRIFNQRGQEISRLWDAPVQAGYYTVDWKGRDHRNRACASGMYYYQLVVGKRFSQTRKMVLVK